MMFGLQWTNLEWKKGEDQSHVVGTSRVVIGWKEKCFPITIASWCETSISDYVQLDIKARLINGNAV